MSDCRCRLSKSSGKRYEKFVKTLRSNFSRSKEAEISRQMNRSQKLKRKNTSKRYLKNEAEAKRSNERVLYFERMKDN